MGFAIFSVGSGRCRDVVLNICGNDDSRCRGDCWCSCIVLHVCAVERPANHRITSVQCPTIGSDRKRRTSPADVEQ